MSMEKMNEIVLFETEDKAVTLSVRSIIGCVFIAVGTLVMVL